MPGARGLLLALQRWRDTAEIEVLSAGPSGSFLDDDNVM